MNPLKRRARWSLTVCLFVILAVAIVSLIGERALRLAGDFLDVGGPPAKADYVVILPGGQETRPFVAAGMVRRGFADQAIILGCEATPSEIDGIVPPSDEITRRILNRRGVADDHIVVLKVPSNSTWADAGFLHDYLSDKPASVIAVVTNDYHTRRARWVFRRVFREESERVCFVSAPSEFFRPSDWWQSKSGIKACVSEYTKQSVYLVLYGGLPVWMTMIGIPVIVIVSRRIWKRRKQTLEGQPNRAA